MRLDLDADLDDLAAAEAANPAATFWLDPPGRGCWGMAPWQRAVAEDPSRRILVRKGNNTGGSALAAWTTRAFLGGWHPRWKRPPGRCRVLFLCADLDSTYKDDVAPVLREFWPDCDLSPRCSFDGMRGFMVAGARGIETAWGDSILFRSGTQTALALSGAKVQLVVINEPPRQHIWGEAMRAASSDAPVFVDFTPLPPEGLVGGDDLRWLRQVVAAEDWSEHVVPLRPETAPWRTPAAIEQQIRDMLPWERAQRRDAAWEGPAPDRRLACFDDSRVFVGDLDALPGCPPSADLRVGLGADHGELTGREAWVLALWTGRGLDARAWILDCYESRGRTTVDDDAHAVVSMLGRRRLRLDQVDTAIGDVNSAGKSSRMRTVNEEFEDAFRRIAGSRATPFRVTGASKGPGSVAYGAHVLDDALGRGALFVHERAEPVVRAFRRWSGSDDEHKHLVDACRYLLVSALDRTASRAAPRMVRG